MNEQVSRQPRTAIVEAVKTVLDRVYTREHACAQCTLGMLLDELGFQEREFVAAGLGVACIASTKTNLKWDALMTAIEVKRSKKKEELQHNRVEDCLCSACVAQRGKVESRAYRTWLNESLKMEELKRKNVE
jgi:hypothetical protein